MRRVIAKLPQYRVNLGLAEKTRWRRVLKSRREDAIALLNNAVAQVRDYAGMADGLVRLALGAGYRMSGGLYQDEMAGMAEELGVAQEDILLGNCTYELAQTGFWLGETFGMPCCTAVAMEVGGKLCHLRNLDWELEGMGASSVVVTLVKKEREIVTVTNPGFVGCLHGMVKGEFSVSMNWAPPCGPATFRWGPVFLLRHVLETAGSYRQAKALLAKTPLSSSCLFLLVGTDDACVIERTQTEWAVRKYAGTPLVVTNHYVDAGLAEWNGDAFVEDSDGRYAAALRRAGRFTGSSLEDASGVLKTERLCAHTVQQMVFCPATGHCVARAFED